MSWQVAFAIAGVSLALASFFKYWFTYKTNKITEDVHKDAVNYLIMNHREELYQELTGAILNAVDLKKEARSYGQE